MACVENILIVGGGIGGLCLAIGLRKAGIGVQIAEIKEDWTVPGVGIIQPANALRALDQLDVGRKCLESNGGYKSYVMCNHLGQKLVEVAGPLSAGEDFPAYNGIPRIMLQSILVEAAISSGAQVKLGQTVESLKQDENGVEITFIDGTTDIFDVVVGADGLHSKIRSLVFPHCEEPTFSGQAVWRYVTKRPKGMDSALFFFGPPGSKSKAGFIPLGEDEMYLLLVTEEPENPKYPDEQLAQLLRKRLDGYGEFVSDVKQSITDSSYIVYKPLLWAFQSDWVKDRVVLIGDAAHAMTPHLGQGASMAIEDAVVLAEELHAKQSIPDAMSGYLLRRFNRSKRVTEGSVQLGEWEQRPTSKMNPVKLTREMEAFLGEPI